MRFVLGTVLLPFNGGTYAFYIVIERKTNVARDWQIRFGTDDKDIAQRELNRLNRVENGAESQG